ncbi:DUF4177 domain-containing protein [Vagococcus sp. BWB3-3]|uniref:DUF4177 domain-containing protein n=1 Tax=Vagococcus allomyrinae TaxID=2794353 RepID=A0A940PDQ6_9ENTE|nr:DUF4177 domain-containing protein [Vagococcus allomyrinae]MBP1040928.1 DUF4177 domain-containing protein [Vagococcus allomyrinae]
MYEYKSEILETSTKWIKDSANEKDLKLLDDLINSRAQQGWELVTHAYMPNVVATRSAFLITFKKTI